MSLEQRVYNLVEAKAETSAHGPGYKSRRTKLRKSSSDPKRSGSLGMGLNPPESCGKVLGSSCGSDLTGIFEPQSDRRNLQA